MNSTKIRSHTVVVWYRVVVTLGAWIDAVLDNASVEFLVLFFDQMHCFTVGNPPERGASYWPTEIPKTCAEGGFLITGLEMRMCSRACDSDGRETEKHHGIETLQTIRLKTDGSEECNGIP